MKKSGLADSPFFTHVPQQVTKPAPPPKNTTVRKEKPTQGKSVDQAVDQLTNRPVNQSIDRPIDQSTQRPAEETIDVDTLGPVVERPRAFYITQKVDRWLDEAVHYLKEKGLHKADRSMLVNALLHDAGLFTSASLDKLRPRLLAHLTNKSLKRIQLTE